MLALLGLTGCRSGKALLPNVSGKAGEVIVVIDKDNWEGALGTAVRDLLACDCPYLAQKEPLYTLVNVAPGSFSDLFKVHRNIVFFGINPQLDSAGVSYLRDVWSTPQCVVQVAAKDASGALDLVRSEGGKIVSAIEQAERDRVIANSMLYEEKMIAQKVSEVFGGSPHFPTGYKLRKITEDFAWISYEKQYSMQGVFIYRYPATGAGDELTVDKIIERRNAALKENVPGMFDNTWMTTGSFLPPQLEYVRYRGRHFAQVRGLWEVENDFMGGPFVSHSFYSLDGQSVVVLEAFVYAPKFDKRQYLRQTEAIIYSWDWLKKELE